MLVDGNLGHPSLMSLERPDRFRQPDVPQAHLSTQPTLTHVNDDSGIGERKGLTIQKRVPDSLLAAYGRSTTTNDGVPCNS